MAKRVCPFCKEKAKINATVCNHCRSELPPLPPKKWYKTGWGILIIFLGLCILMNAIFGNDTKQSQVTKPTGKTVQRTAQSPKKTDLEILTEIENRVKQFQSHLRKYYPEDDMQRTLSDDLRKITIAEFGYSKPENEEQRKVLSKAKMLRPKVELLEREVYAGIMERKLMEKGIDANVKAIGEGKRTLLYKHALVTRASAYKLMNESPMAETARNLGFKKIVFKNFFDDSWTYDLTRK
jgi:hypothetical protein